MAKDDKVIKVYDKDGRYLSLCSVEIRDKLVKRNCATVLSNDEIRLKVNDEDRKKIKERVLIRDRRICYICGSTIPEYELATVDHVKSKYKHGKDTGMNLKCSCVRCNADKGIMKLTQYVKHIKNNREKYTHISKSQLQHLEKLAVTYDVLN